MGRSRVGRWGHLAYLATRPHHGPASKEIGIFAHGPDADADADADADKLTARFTDLLINWNRTRPPRPVITAYPQAHPTASKPWTGASIGPAPA